MLSFGGKYRGEGIIYRVVYSKTNEFEKMDNYTKTAHALIVFMNENLGVDISGVEWILYSKLGK